MAEDSQIGGESKRAEVYEFAQHVVHRPDTYIGGIEPREYVFPAYKIGEDGKSFSVEKFETATFSAGIPQLVSEVLSNAVDHSFRHPDKVKNIAVTIDRRNEVITVRNDGPGIPVMLNEEQQKYDPEIVFSVPMSGTNFDDTEKRDVGGRNGFGAKLTNAASLFFKATTCDGVKTYTQTWEDHMSKTEGPKITKAKSKKQFTEVSFRLDYDFVSPGTDPERKMYKFIEHQIWQLSAMTAPSVKIKATIKYNIGFPDTEYVVPCKSFKQYATMFGKPLYHGDDPDIEVAIMPRTAVLPPVMGFVNSISCSEGSHVTHVVNKLKKMVVAKSKGTVKPTTGSLLEACTIFVKIRMDKPAFGDQAKTKLTKPLNDVKLEWKPPDKMADKLKWLVDRLSGKQDEDAASKVDDLKMKAGDRIEKYIKAGNAGKKGKKCTVLITEGDSAKGFATSGLSVLGYDEYGVFPIRGKLYNLRNEKKRQEKVLQNAELSSLVRIIGQPGKLNYTSVGILADQDYDGSHIGGLIINFLDIMYPEALRTQKDFVKRIATPVVKATKGAAVKMFMTEYAFEQWWAAEGKDAGGFKVKYYKGLGTSTPKEAKEIFADLEERYMVAIDCTDPEHLDMLDMCFDDKKAAERRELIRHAVESGEVHEIDYSRGSITLKEFLLGEIVPFFLYNVQRQIPSLYDGMAPSHRKILWTMLKRKSKDEIKVEHLAGEVSKGTGYKHGEKSLSGAIVGLAQDWPLNNMINLLRPNGNFGNRHGEGAASGRYIYTELEPIARPLFPEADYPALAEQVSEGQVIEPVHLMPVVPLLLINGCTGVASGWSVDVPQHSVEEVLGICRKYATYSLSEKEEKQGAMEWEPLPALQSYPVEGTLDGKSWVFKPLIELDGKELHVRDLPRETDKIFAGNKFNMFCEAHPFTETDRRTDTKVDMTLHFKSEESASAGAGFFRERGEHKIKSQNMCLLCDGNERVPRRFDGVDAIMAEFARKRVQLYEKRFRLQREAKQAEIDALQIKRRFVSIVLEDPAAIAGKVRKDVETYLCAKGLDLDDYGKVLRLAITTLTKEEIAKIDEALAKAEGELARIKCFNVGEEWLKELDALEAAYKEYCGARQKRREEPPQNDRPAKKARKQQKKK